MQLMISLGPVLSSELCLLELLIVKYGVFLKETYANL